MLKRKVKNVRFTPKEMSAQPPTSRDLAGMIPIIGRGVYHRANGERALKVRYVIVDDSSVTFSLDDGRKVSAPLEWYPRLEHATPVERNDWRLALGGRVVIWKSLGIGIAVEALLEGVKANESEASLRRWLELRKPPRRKAG